MFFWQHVLHKTIQKEQKLQWCIEVCFFCSSLFSLFKADPPPALGWLLLKMFLLQSAINSYIIRLFFHFNDFSPPFFLKMSFSHFARLLYFFSSSQSVTARATFLPHIYFIFFSFLPAGLGLFYSPIQNVTSQIPVEIYPTMFLQIANQSFSALSSLHLLILLHNVDSSSSKQYYVYGIVDTVSALKKIAFIITLNFFRCYISNFTIHPGIS